MSTHALNVQPSRTARHSGQLHTNVSKTNAYVMYTHNSDHNVNIIYIYIKYIYLKRHNIIHIMSNPNTIVQVFVVIKIKFRIYFLRDITTINSFQYTNPVLLCIKLVPIAFVQLNFVAT